MESLKAMFRAEELELAASIGQQSNPLRDRVLESFRALKDPLLSADDVQHLLRIANRDDVVEALGVLVEDKHLEKTNTTSRPLDARDVELYRLAGVTPARLRLVGVESRLSDGSTRFQFTCDGRLIRSIARIDRLDAVSGTGNQREEINTHVHKIAAGIQAGTQVPNPVLLVLNKELVTRNGDEDAPQSYIRIHNLAEDFTRVMSPVDENAVIQEFRPVELDFPYRRAAFDDEKAALLVDGQQRTAALSMVDIDSVPAFALSVNAEVTTTEQAKTVFMVANSTAKIETKFSRALAATMGQSPGFLAQERPRAVASMVLAIKDPESPFFGIVQYPGTQKEKKQVVAYNSLFQVVSAFHDSSLPLDSKKPEDTLVMLVKRSYQLVAKNWASAWGLKPGDSRLMHGVGLRSMAALLVSKLETLFPDAGGDLNNPELWAAIEASMKRLEPQIVWTVADTAQATKSAKSLYTDEIANRQNTSQDIKDLTKVIKRLSLELDTLAAKAKTKK
jgi:DGQHR domain-containing protein